MLSSARMPSRRSRALCKRGEDIALIFADVRLPGLLDGVDLALRVKVLWPQITMMVTTGYRGRSRLEALPDNVVYMPKPWLALDVLMQAEQACDRGCSSSRRAESDDDHVRVRRAA